MPRMTIYKFHMRDSKPDPDPEKAKRGYFVYSTEVVEADTDEEAVEKLKARCADKTYDVGPWGGRNDPPLSIWFAVTLH